MHHVAASSRLLLVLVAAMVGAGGCGPRVDCAKLCARTLACEVTFGNTDDPDGTLIADGTRTDEEACALGCGESPVVTVDSARCIDALDIGSDPGACQNDVLQCLELEPPASSDATSG